MKVLNLTPECFVEIIVLCIFWEHGARANYQRGGWTTIDHILKVLHNLGCVTETQIKTVQGKKQGIILQRSLLRRCGTTYGSEYAVDSRSWILYRQGVHARGKGANLMKLVRNMRIELLEQAIPRAIEFQDKYAEFLSKDRYISEAVRINELYETSAASASASKRYREKITEELSSEV